MSSQSADISSVKLGLLVAWPAFWTGVPLKAVLALLFLAMGVHPWEGAGLVFMLLLSIPIDIWALSLVARTVFLERLRLEPPTSIGVTLWWQAALLSAIYLPLLYFVETGVVAGGQWLAQQIVSLPLLEQLPIAEKIGVELTIWGSLATVVLLVLVLGWLYLFGWIVRRQTREGATLAESYQALVRRWDQLRIPGDQPLHITVFTAVGVVLILCFWGFMPVTTPHPHEDYVKATGPKKPFEPVAALEEAEKKLLQVEVTLEKLESEDGGAAKGSPGKDQKRAKPRPQ